MNKQQQSPKRAQTEKEPRRKTPTFLLELPLEVNAGQAKRIRGHLEAGRQFYNVLLSEGQRRLRRMRDDPAWQAARALPATRRHERAAAFRALREQYGFSEYALHAYAKRARQAWIADHLDAVLAQTLASRAYHALNRVCLGAARRIRFKSRGRGLSSIENKRNDTGLRFVLQQPAEGNQGYLIWKDDRLAALIDWNDPVVKYGLDHPIKYVRLVQRKASSPQAQAADVQGYRYSVQLALEGVPYRKPRHTVGSDTVGADVGPSTIALVPQEAAASLEVFCEDLVPDAQHVRRLQRQMDRQRRAANPDNYDEQGRINKQGPRKLHWKVSRNYEKTRRRKATKERKLAAHRKSLHGKKVHETGGRGQHHHPRKAFLQGLAETVWAKRWTASPRHVCSTLEAHRGRARAASCSRVPTRSTKLSQFCHGCGKCLKKPLSQRWHQCACGVGPVQRDLYAAFLAAYLDPDHLTPSCAEVMSFPPEGAEARLRAAHEQVQQRANEGQSLPRSMGIARAGARRPSSLSEVTPEPAFLFSQGRLEAWKRRSEPPLLEQGEFSVERYSKE